MVDKAAERSRFMYKYIHPDYPLPDDPTTNDLKVLGSEIGSSSKWLVEGGCDNDLTVFS
jgi:hypothetical protein